MKTLIDPFDFDPEEIKRKAEEPIKTAYRAKQAYWQKQYRMRQAAKAGKVYQKHGGARKKKKEYLVRTIKLRMTRLQMSMLEESPGGVEGAVNRWIHSLI